METAVKQETPQVGMSVSMHIGSDSYHEIVVKTERNAKVIYTMSAGVIFRALTCTLEEWNSRSPEAKKMLAANVFVNRIASELASGESLEEAMRQNTDCYTYRATGRNAGRYVEKGSDHCRLKLNSQYHYMDPSF